MSYYSFGLMGVPDTAERPTVAPHVRVTDAEEQVKIALLLYAVGTPTDAIMTTIRINLAARSVLAESWRQS